MLFVAAFYYLLATLCPFFTLFALVAFFAKHSRHAFHNNSVAEGEIFICATCITVGLCLCDSFRSVNLAKYTQLQPLFATRILAYSSISLLPTFLILFSLQSPFIICYCCLRITAVTIDSFSPALLLLLYVGRSLNRLRSSYLHKYAQWFWLVGA